MRSQPAPQIDWAEHISQWRASKLTRTEYCRQQNIKFHTFVYQVKRRSQVKVAPLTLVPVKVREVSTTRDLVLQGPKGWSLTLSADISAGWLADLLGSL